MDKYELSVENYQLSVSADAFFTSERNQTYFTVVCTISFFTVKLVLRWWYSRVSNGFYGGFYGAVRRTVLSESISGSVLSGK